MVTKALLLGFRYSLKFRNNLSDRELQKGLVQDNIKYPQVELGRLVMGSRRRLNKKTSWESTSLPVRNPLQPRPFGKGIQARRAELPTTNVLQTRPFGTPKQASSPKQEMPDLQAKLKQAESFGYNAANIPTVPSSSATPIQAKLTIGEPNDKYEQEADQVASQVVNQINSPQSQPSVQGKTVQRQEMPEEEEELQTKPLAESIQRQEMPEEEEELQTNPLAESIQRQEMPEEEEELQTNPLAESIQRQEMPEEEEELQTKPLAESIQRQEMPEEEEELQTKPLAESIQRQEMPEEEEELQAKPLAESIQRQEMPEEEELQMKPLVQRQSSGGGMAATPELEQSIASARGNGQPIADEVRQPMEQAFGADLSGVKIHTDSKADHLNRSVGARAFTTGQDVFFRQGEYNPGSKDGQELMAHEFTHVLQQSSGSMETRKQAKVSQPANANLQGNWLTDAVSSVGNAIGDALDIRDNEAALDLWEDYQDAVQERKDFTGQKHTAQNFQSTTRLGLFDVIYNPATGELKIVCKCKFNFINGSATEFPSASPEDLSWETDKGAKKTWKQNFLSACSNAWSGNHTFYCQKDWWESLQASVTVDFKEVSKDEHFALDIKKIPTREFSRSGVYRPTPRPFGLPGYNPGRGEFDSEDLTEVNKPGGRQSAAVHEAGHMLGLDDEYGTGTPSHSDLVESEFGHGVARGSDGRIMSGGMDIQPEHGVTFLEALKKATDMSEWSTTQKEPKPIPPNPSLMNMGDFPEPNSDTKFA
ncbi:eCIS core domain-containing protein [Coleofasciculus sp. E2-BRE-01]|uniref:eCIS core domain-containing protein n=1 Tax=Coleofasciculus sp. E2-BRE-01 TaxID=3069524 RepID=UPI00406453F1